MENRDEEDQDLQLYINWVSRPQKLVKSIVSKLANLLLSGYYINVRCHSLQNGSIIRNQNVLNIPGNIINRLFRLTFSLSYPKVPKESAVRPLLMCCLKDVNIRFTCTYPNLNNLIDIIETLSHYTDNITTLCITSNNGYSCVTNQNNVWNDETMLCLYEAFTKLVSRCRKLTKLKVDFLFNDKILLSLPNIEELDIAFLTQYSDIYRFCREFRIENKIKLMNDLKKLKFLNCGELDLFDKSTKDQLGNIPLTKPCKIKFLKIDKKATVNTFKVIERYFPDLTDIQICADRYKRTDYIRLNKFLKEYKLHINGKFFSDQYVFKQYGPQITHLAMDFGQIEPTEFLYMLYYLPNLLILNVNFICFCWSPLAFISTTFRRTPLRTLKELKLICCRHLIDKYELYKDFLIYVLSRCFRVEKLVVDYIGLDDTIMDAIIKKNHLNFIKEIVFGLCNLTEKTVIDLVFYKRSLEYIKISRGEKNLNSSFGKEDLNLIKLAHVYNPYLIIDI